MTMWRALLLSSVVCVLFTSHADAQVDGSVSMMVDVFPDLSDQAGRQSASELRTRVFVERKQDVGDHLRLELSGYFDALVGDRLTGAAREAIVRPQDLYAEFHGERFDLRAGFSRIVWGKLDEFQPTDVVNPIDLTRFLLEGRSEARLPAGLVRGRWFFRNGTAVEGIVVPAFRASRFDQLDEATSPFNLSASDVRIALPVERREPAASWQNVSGGARVTSTLGRVDVGVSAFRGYRSFPLLSIDPPRGLLESFPRFTMVGGDVEAVRGAWGVRGEVAGFVEDRVQSPDGAAPIEARTVDAGIGVDRRAGDYRIAANAMYSHRLEDDFTLVIAADRSFARETRTARLFAVYNPSNGTTFTRAILMAALRDNVAVEGSGGIFSGVSDDTLGRLTQRDFLYARLKVFF